MVAALGSRQDWLVVFDNAQGPGDLAGMLPGGGGHVLITSRNRAVERGRLAAGPGGIQPGRVGGVLAQALRARGA